MESPHLKGQVQAKPYPLASPRALDYEAGLVIQRPGDWPADTARQSRLL